MAIAQSSKSHQPQGMFAFALIWIGQLVSVIATQMTGFAMTIWIYEKTSSATALGLANVFWVTPYLLISPIAGVMVDRYSRKLMMMVSDIGAGLATAGILVLQVMGVLQLWHIYVAVIFQGLVNAFQWPAYSAAITTMVSKKQYGRANGMMSLVDVGPGVIAPVLAGALIGFIKLAGILTIDVVTYGLAILALVVVFVPQPPPSQEGQKARSNIWKESAFGFKYIFSRPSLTGLLTLFLLGNLFTGMAFTLIAPAILARTNNNSIMLGTAQSFAAVAGVVGAVLMSAWGGFKRRINGIIAGWFFSSLLGMTLFGFGRSLAIWIPAGMLMMLFVPLINGSSQAIWQSKVAPDVQGRVFATRRFIAQLLQPIAPVIAGTLADFVLEPAMKAQTGLSQTFGGWFGSGSGAGMGMLITLCGLLTALIACAALFVPVIRHVEDLLPDHDQVPAATPAAEGSPAD